MPEIRISITLPYALGLAEGEYQTAQVGESIRLSVPPLEETSLRTLVSATFQHDDIADPDERQRVRAQMRIAFFGGPIACCAGLARFVSGPRSPS